jgi:riboflavin kinase/FMN adenylyltransferase
VHILNFEGNIYEQPMRIEFIDFLRPETKFSSVDELILQIQKDKEATEQRLSK